MFAFSNKNMSLTELEKIYFSIEGDLSTENINNIPVISLMKSIKNKYFIRNIEDSSVYHLANVFVSNLVLSLLEIGTGYLRKLGLNEKDALEALFPLIQGNMDSIHKNGFENSLTGPVARGDIKTIKKHLKILNGNDKELYNFLSLNLLKLVAERRCHNDECNYTNIINKSLCTKDYALNELLNTSTKYKEIFQLLGGTE